MGCTIVINGNLRHTCAKAHKPSVLRFGVVRGSAKAACMWQRCDPLPKYFGHMLILYTTDNITKRHTTLHLHTLHQTLQFYIDYIMTYFDHVEKNVNGTPADCCSMVSGHHSRRGSSAEQLHRNTDSIEINRNTMLS